MYIDLHGHLDKVEDIDKVVDNAKVAGVSIAVCSGISPKSNRKALYLSKRYSIIKPTIGLYPIDAMQNEIKKEYEPDVDAEMDFIRQHKNEIGAIGEIGLDFKTGNDKEEQEKLFRRQLELAKELDKPVIIHSRKAEAKVFDILKDYDVKVILHCFSGKKKLVLEGIKREYYFTVPTNVVRSEQFQFMAKEVPLSQLFCETDTPFLSPYPDKSNEPAFIVESYKMIAKIKEMELTEVTNIIYNNYQKLFL